MEEYIEIKREFLEEILEDEIELLNIAYERNKKLLADHYQSNIDQIESLLAVKDQNKCPLCGDGCNCKGGA